MRKQLSLYYQKPLVWLKKNMAQYWRKNLWHKIVMALAALALLCVGGMYGIARWYIAQNSGKPLVLGASFIPAYAQSLGVDPKQAMDELIHDVGVRHFRLVSYWDELEPSEGTYNFSQLDWQFAKAEAAGAKITLSVGLRQPRWPECHMPAWAADKTESQWQPQLEAFMTAVVNRYKHSPALASYQVENEFFLKGFGTCEQIAGSMDRQRLVNEFNLVKRLDPAHTAIIARSNNALGMPVGQPTPDEFGISIYKRVWDSAVTHHYIEYPFPAWFYAFLAGAQKLLTGRDMIVHELQAESWAPHGQALNQISLDEANKSFDAARFKTRVQYGEATGMREIYLWGAEYWYYRLVQQHDPSLWNVAKDAFHQANTSSN